jgi:16S rRNA processing protein RimM
VPDWDAMAVVGRVARPHGLRGQVIVNPETDFPGERFQPGAELFVNRAGRAEPITITTVRFQQQRPVIGLHGVDDMNAAATLAGAELRVPTDRLAVLPPDTFYRHNLIGCAVETRGGAVIGLVEDVEGTMGGSRLVVRATDGIEVLVPLAAEICTLIDPAARRIVIDPPEGLLELNERAQGKGPRA